VLEKGEKYGGKGRKVRKKREKSTEEKGEKYGEKREKSTEEKGIVHLGRCVP
jgi:hypothetical protein